MKNLCIVIGGSKGLGAQLCSVYQQAQYDVVEFSRSGTEPYHQTVDMGRRETTIDTIDAFLAEAAQTPWTQVHLLVNAGVLTPIGPLFTSEPKQWWHHIDVNFTLPLSIIGRFQTHFKDHAARKVVGYVSSGAAKNAFDGWSLYGASKAGMEQFIRSMALEQARLPLPILTTILDPGVMDTDMQASIRASDIEHFSQHGAFVSRYESGGLGDPLNVAGNIFQQLQKPFENGGVIRVADY